MKSPSFNFLLISVCSMTIICCCGFLGFFESQQEKDIKNLIDTYRSQPYSELLNLNLDKYPDDIQRSFRELVVANYQLSKCSPSSTLGIIWDLYTGIADAMDMGDGTPDSQRCIQEWGFKAKEARAHFISVCKKYGISESYFQKSAKK